MYVTAKSLTVTICVCVLAAAAPGPVNVTACASGYSDATCCDIFTVTIQVKFCPGTGDESDFYVYQLKAATFCDMAYCAIKVDSPSGIPHLISTLSNVSVNSYVDDLVLRPW